MRVKYFLVFTAIGLVPLALLYLVQSEQLLKLKDYGQYTYNEYINETHMSLIPEDAVQNLSQSDLLKVEKRMEMRRKLMKEKCSELGLDILGNDSLHKPNAWEFLVNRKHHIIWCNVFKAASSSWMFNFNVLAGFSPDFLHNTNKILLTLARTRYPRVSVKELQAAQDDSITFIIARHPFERLLSAYRDKMVYALPFSYHDKLGRRIVRRYRKKDKDKNNPKYPTFPEFVRWLITQWRQNIPIDMHFIPATTFCTPCLIHFDVILKFETLEEDQLYLIEKTGLKRIIAPEWRNPGKGKNTLELLQQFYSQLSFVEMKSLFDYFRNDFLLFDYSAAPYFDLIKSKRILRHPKDTKPTSITTTTKIPVGAAKATIMADTVPVIAQS